MLGMLMACIVVYYLYNKTVTLPPYPFLNDIFVDGGLTSNILLN